MSAYRKQAIPLVFVELVRDAMLQTNSEPEFLQAMERVNGALDACWACIQIKGCDPGLARACRMISESYTRMQAAIERTVWERCPTQCGAELLNGLSGIVEDTVFQLPKNKFPERIAAWEQLAAVVYDLCALSEVDEPDDECYRTAAMLADIVRSEIDR